ncbi:hypothetical protein TNIN_393481 [Trichonephila inaurata madagascariensis]|uniref:Uncharacterized protein n=1 Tax=Trichonephila inaurata madagascariensis TaxID=2747483 RepID=A0A8X6IWQ4_9ARAC|nr:hypothetical protein TNIN_393481 [Trichonephila inaurata madagascariensis]
MRKRCSFYCEPSHSFQIIECNCANKTVEDCFGEFISRWRLLSDAHLIRRNPARGREGRRSIRSRRPPKEKRCGTCLVVGPPKSRLEALFHWVQHLWR